MEKTCLPYRHLFNQPINSVPYAEPQRQHDSWSTQWSVFEFTGKECSVNIMLMQGGILLFLVLSYSPVFVCEENTIRWLTKEDGFYEWVGALCFLITSIVFFIRFIGDKYGNDFIIFKTNRNIFYITFAIAFFFAFGEEISWGQRILNIATPEALKTINFQNETNIHNLIIPLVTNSDGQVALPIHR